MPNLRTSCASLALLVCAATLAAAGSAAAETEISFYLGVQDSPHSRIRGSDPTGIGDFSFLVDWEGKSFSAPPYYGARLTWWRTERLGFGVEFTHDKVYAKNKADGGFSTLELTDGVNVATVNVMYRWAEPDRRWTPYVGAGIGISVPHVEVASGGEKTFEYQYGGPAGMVLAGMSYSLNDRWKLFGEYKFSYTRLDVDLDGGGSLKTNLPMNALNFGVSYSF